MIEMSSLPNLLKLLKMLVLTLTALTVLQDSSSRGLETWGVEVMALWREVLCTCHVHVHPVRVSLSVNSVCNQLGPWPTWSATLFGKMCSQKSHRTELVTDRVDLKPPVQCTWLYCTCTMLSMYMYTVCMCIVIPMHSMMFWVVCLHSVNIRDDIQVLTLCVVIFKRGNKMGKSGH